MNICMFVLMLLNCGVGEDSRVPWRARRSNQSLLKEINLEYSLQELMLKPKLQHFGHLLRRADSLEKTLMLGKIEGRIRRGWQRMRWLDGITDSMDMVLQSQTWLRNWTKYLCVCVCIHIILPGDYDFYLSRIEKLDIFWSRNNYKTYLFWLFYTYNTLF